MSIRTLTIYLTFIGALLLSTFFYFSFVYHKTHGAVWIPGGDFLMGSNAVHAKANEKPAHLVHVDGFWMDKADVTNRQFAQFVRDTGYITTAEQKPDWEQLKLQLPRGMKKPADDKLVPGAMFSPLQVL